MSTNICDSQPWYRNRWPWLLMAGPAAVVVAGFITLWLAVNSDDGLVTDDYYKQGLTVNQKKQREHAASDFGLRGDLMRSGAGVRLLLSSDSGAILPDAIVLKLAHPTRAGHDQAVQMKSEGQGFYGGFLTEDLSGRWLVSIEDPAGKWRLHGEWIADGTDHLRISARGG